MKYPHDFQILTCYLLAVSGAHDILLPLQHVRQVWPSHILPSHDVRADPRLCYLVYALRFLWLWCQQCLRHGLPMSSASKTLGPYFAGNLRQYSALLLCKHVHHDCNRLNHVCYAYGFHLEPCSATTATHRSESTFRIGLNVSLGEMILCSKSNSISAWSL